MIKIMLIITIVILVIVYGFVHDRGIIKRRYARLQDRTDMNDDEIFNTYYKDTGISKESVSLVIRQVAQIFQIPMFKIWPTDNFNEVYKTCNAWEHGNDCIEVIWFVENVMENAGIRKFNEIVRLETVDDVIRIVDKMEKQK